MCRTICLVIVFLVATNYVKVQAAGHYLDRYIGDFCITDEDCTDLIHHSRCETSNKTCVCKDGFHNVRKLCSRVLNAQDVPCFKDCDCSHFVPNSECINHECKCKTGFQAVNHFCREVLPGSVITTTTGMTTTTTYYGD